MKLSNKGRYALRALFDIAFFNEGRPTQVKDIAERQAIPPRFLEQIFQDLKRAGFVASKRGPQGGYSLVRPPEEIRLGEVFEVTEGPCTFTENLDPASEPPAPPAHVKDTKALTERALAELGAQVRTCLDGLTIGTLCERARAEGFGQAPPQGYVYMI